MSDNWKENVLKNLKNRLKPRNIFKYLKSSPFKSSLVIALFFSYIYTNARINERYNLVGLDSPINLFNASSSEDDYYPPTGTLCGKIANAATNSKYLLKDAYLAEFVATKYPDFAELPAEEWFSKVYPIYENIEYALEEGCKEEAAKISSDGWWYVFFITTVFNMGMITLGRHFYEKNNYY